MNAIVWSLEWSLALARRRLFVLEVLGPAVVVWIAATGALTPGNVADGAALLFVAFGTFGSALTLVREGERGMTQRVLRGGVGPVTYLLQRTAAQAAVDMVQLTPALLIGSVLLHGSVTETVVAFGGVITATWVANLVGVLVAGASRSQGEAALFCGLATLLLVHMSGFFRTPDPATLAGVLEAYSPFAFLDEALERMTGGTAMGGWVGAVTWGIALPLFVALLSPGLCRAVDGLRRKQPEVV